MGDVYMVNGKILSGLPNHAKDIIFDNTGTTLSSTNTEDAIKEVNSNLYVQDYSTSNLLISLSGTHDDTVNISHDGYYRITLIATSNNEEAYIRTGSKTILSVYRRNGSIETMIPIKSGTTITCHTYGTGAELRIEEYFV